MTDPMTTEAPRREWKPPRLVRLDIGQQTAGGAPYPNINEAGHVVAHSTVGFYYSAPTSAAAGTAGPAPPS